MNSSAANRQNALVGRASILKLITQGAPVEDTLKALALTIEEEACGLLCGICVFDRSGTRVQASIGPSLPSRYRTALVGIPLAAPYLAPCAQVAAEGKPVVVERIEDDARWPATPWRNLAVRCGLHSCRSTPIVASTGAVCASFVFYSAEAGGVAALDADWAEDAANLASIAVEKDNAEAERKVREERLLFAIEGAEVGTWDLDLETRAIYGSERFHALFGLPPDSETTYESIIEVVHPDDRDRVTMTVNAALDSGSAYDCEFRVIWPDASIHWIADKGRGFTNGGAKPAVMRGIVIDISARKFMEQSANENAARFRFLAESIPHKTFTATPDGEIDYLNQQWSEYTNLPVEEIMRRGWREFVHPDDINEKSRRWEHAMENGSPFEFEHRFLHSDGTYRWHLSRATPYRDGGGKIVLWVGSNTDVDDLKRAHLEVQEREMRFRTMADATPVLIWMADLTKSCTYFNKQWLEFTGRSLEEELGGGWAESVHPDDRARAVVIYNDSFEHKEAFKMEYRLRRHDGEFRWLIDCGQPLHRGDGEFIGFIGGCMDIHEQKKLEHRLRNAERRARLAVEAAGMGFWDWTSSGTASWSPECARILGLEQNVPESSPAALWASVHPEDRDSFFQAFEQSRTNGNDFSAEFRVTDKSGGIRWISAHGRAFFDGAAGALSRVLGVVQDITEHRSYENQLKQNQAELRSALTAAELAREQAETAGRAKDRFLAVLSHELRTPLTPVLMAVGTIRSDKSVSEHTRAAIEMIQRNVEIEARLIADLLDLTRIARNQLRLELKPMDIHLAVRHAIEVCEPDIHAKALTFRVDLAATRSLVDGDMARLQQVFWNLIQNAVKFAPDNGFLSITSRNEGETVRVDVRDSGIGLTADMIGRIFNPFEQGDDTFERQFGGLGLGLAICKATTDAHSGVLSAESDGLGKGALFSVTLTTIQN